MAVYSTLHTGPNSHPGGFQVGFLSCGAEGDQRQRGQPGCDGSEGRGRARLETRRPPASPPPCTTCPWGPWNNGSGGAQRSARPPRGQQRAGGEGSWARTWGRCRWQSLCLFPPEVAGPSCLWTERCPWCRFWGGGLVQCDLAPLPEEGRRPLLLLLQSHTRIRYKFPSEEWEQLRKRCTARDVDAHVGQGSLRKLHSFSARGPLRRYRVMFLFPASVLCMQIAVFTLALYHSF